MFVSLSLDVKHAYFRDGPERWLTTDYHPFGPWFGVG